MAKYKCKLVVTLYVDADVEIHGDDIVVHHSEPQKSCIAMMPAEMSAETPEVVKGVANMVMANMFENETKLLKHFLGKEGMKEQPVMAQVKTLQ